MKSQSLYARKSMPKGYRIGVGNERRGEALGRVQSEGFKWVRAMNKLAKGVE
jgi:hypothetical protein